MRQVFPFSVHYSSKYILIPQTAMLAPSWSASVIKAARNWQILKLGKTHGIIQHSWFGCLFGIWCRFNKLSCKKWKPQAVAGKAVGREGSWCTCAAAELGVCSLCTPESGTVGCSGVKPEPKPSFSTRFLGSRSAEGIQLPPRSLFLVFSVLSGSCLPAAYTVGLKKRMCEYFVSHSSPRSSFWNSKQAQNPKKISLSCE